MGVCLPQTIISLKLKSLIKIFFRFLNFLVYLKLATYKVLYIDVITVVSRPPKPMNKFEHFVKPTLAKIK